VISDVIETSRQGFVRCEKGDEQDLRVVLDRVPDRGLHDAVYVVGLGVADKDSNSLCRMSSVYRLEHTPVLSMISE
jgi:hypothetical protein